MAENVRAAAEQFLEFGPLLTGFFKLLIQIDLSFGAQGLRDSVRETYVFVDWISEIGFRPKLIKKL